MDGIFEKNRKNLLTDAAACGIRDLPREMVPLTNLQPNGVRLMKTAASQSLSTFSQINKWKIWNAKRLGITVEEFDRRIEERKLEYQRQREAKAAEQAKKLSESRKRLSYENAVFEGRFAGTFEEYKCGYIKVSRRNALSAEEKKQHRKNCIRKRTYATAVEKGKFNGTFEEYCQHLDWLHGMTPQEKMEYRLAKQRTYLCQFRYKRQYKQLIDAGYKIGTFEEFSRTLAEADKLKNMLRKIKKTEKTA